MKAVPWPLPAAASLLFLGAGATIWQVNREQKLHAERAGSPSTAASLAENAKRQTRPGAGKSPISMLPRHLKRLVGELEAQADFMNETFTHGEFLAAREEAASLLEPLSREDLEKLIKFYVHPGRKIGSQGYELIDTPLFEKWGRAHPERVVRFVEEEFRTALPNLTEPVNLFDPFGSGLESGVTPEQIAALFQGMASVNPAMAREAWDGIVELVADHPFVKNFHFINNDVQGGISRGWASSSPHEAWNYLLENLGDVSQAWPHGFFAGLDAGAPWKQIAEELHHLESKELVYLAADLAAGWARHDPDAAVRWHLEHALDTLRSMFERWHDQDYFGEALSWLLENSASLPEETRFMALRVALARQTQRHEELVTFLATLPRDKSTWAFLEDLAWKRKHESSVPLEAARLLSLTENLQAPEAVRREVERLLNGGSPFDRP